jgi:hypothetical protein
VRNQALYRQWQILHTISSSNSSGVSKAQLAEEFGVSKKTIARDITNLSTCGFPIYADDEQDMEGHVFYFFTPGYRLPDISFSFDELLTLQMVSVFHKSYNGAFSEPFAILIKKIRSTLDPATARFSRHLQRAVLSDTDAVLTILALYSFWKAAEWLIQCFRKRPVNLVLMHKDTQNDILTRFKVSIYIDGKSEQKLKANPVKCRIPAIPVVTYMLTLRHRSSSHTTYLDGCFYPLDKTEYIHTIQESELPKPDK